MVNLFCLGDRTVWLCSSTHNILLTLLGAEEVVYAQVGDTVTLKPPEGKNLQRQYLYWFFSDLQVAWRNSFGGKGVHEGEQCIELFTDTITCFNHQQMKQVLIINDLL